MIIRKCFGRRGTQCITLGESRIRITVFCALLLSKGGFTAILVQKILRSGRPYEVAFGGGFVQALLIIDVQNDYFPAGRSELVGAVEALGRIKTVLKQFREKKYPVIFIKHINTAPNASFFLPNTSGVEIHAEITPSLDETVVVKHAPNSFFQTTLLQLLRDKGIGELVVCGMMTHMCIDTTVRAAKDYGIPITLLYDACATKDLHIMGKCIPAEVVHDAYMAGLSGMFAEIKLTEQLQLSSQG